MIHLMWGNIIVNWKKEITVELYELHVTRKKIYQEYYK